LLIVLILWILSDWLMICIKVWGGVYFSPKLKNDYLNLILFQRVIFYKNLDIKK